MSPSEHHQEPGLEIRSGDIRQAAVDGRDTDGTTTRWSRLWWVFLLGSAGGIVVYQLLPPGLAQDAVYQVFGLASATAMVVGVRLHQPVRRSSSTRRPPHWTC
ncbi:MAG TPA: hypothetical protein VFP34_14400 [Microlunatus sp.]|nr:hypothetical protein [Microlunatus sp.]